MFSKIKTPFSAEGKDVDSHACHILLHREYASAASHSALKCTVSKYAIGSLGYRIVMGKGLPPYLAVSVVWVVLRVTAHYANCDHDYFQKEERPVRKNGIYNLLSMQYPDDVGITATANG